MLNAGIKEVTLIGKKILLSDINFELKNNSIQTILGLNGSGKTTLIKALTGLLNPRFYSVEGNVFFQGRDILKLDSGGLLGVRKNSIKYVFQDAVNSFDHLKTFEFYFNRITQDKEQINNLLEYFLLPEYTELNRLYPYEVSGGMAQRISFVMALLANPKIIILDEPTSGIDTAITNLFMHKLNEYITFSDNSVLLVTHDITFAAKISNEIAFLSEGKLSRFYNKEDLLTSLKNSSGDSVLLLKEGMEKSELLNNFFSAYRQLSV